MSLRLGLAEASTTRREESLLTMGSDSAVGRTGEGRDAAMKALLNG